MKVVFSFCIYGTSPKYCQGLVENLKLIEEHFPSALVYIYCYHDVPDEYIVKYRTFRCVQLRISERFDKPNMVDRFFVLDEDPSVDVVIVRDTDSRLHARDRVCILHFLESTSLCHTTRDHHLHHSPILGGLWGMKRGCLNVDMRELYRTYMESRPRDVSSYGHDMYFLRECVYPLVVHDLLVYTFHDYLRLDEREKLIIMPSTIQDNDFCGQVVDYDANGREVKQFSFPM